MVKPDQQRFRQLSRNLFNRNLRDRWNQGTPLNLSPYTRALNGFWNDAVP
jgi:hypothetical protein